MDELNNLRELRLVDQAYFPKTHISWSMSSTYKPLPEASTSLSQSYHPPSTSVDLHHVPERARRQTEVRLLCSEHHAGCGRIEDDPIPWAPSR